MKRLSFILIIFLAASLISCNSTPSETLNLDTDLVATNQPQIIDEAESPTIGPQTVLNPTEVLLPTDTPLSPKITPTRKPAATPQPEAGSFRETEDGMPQIYIPSGPFMMGGEGTDDSPQHSVELGPYWIDRTEVSKKQFLEFIEETGQDISLPAYQTEEKPVTFISWFDALAYCHWRGQDLPTAAEWEKAARWDEANQRSLVYPWGDTQEPVDKYWDHIGAVGSTLYDMSPYSVFEMAGNVQEWVFDYHIPRDTVEYWTSSNASIDPIGQLNSLDQSIDQDRTVKGGGWASLVHTMGYQQGVDPSSQFDFIGFRCVSRISGPIVPDLDLYLITGSINDSQVEVQEENQGPSFDLKDSPNMTAISLGTVSQLNPVSIGEGLISPPSLFSLKGTRDTHISSFNGYVTVLQKGSSILISELQQKKTYSIDMDSVAAALDLSKDGKQLLIGRQNGEILIWDVYEGRKVQSFVGHSGPISKLNFSNDDSIIASYSDGDKKIRIWDAENTSQRDEFELNQQLWSDIQFSNLDRYVSGLVGNNLHLWNLENGNKINSFELDLNSANNSSKVSSILSPKRDTIVISYTRGDGMKIVDIWNVKLGEKQISIEGAADPTFLNFEQDLITVHKNEFKFWSISESSVIEESIVASEMPIAKVWVLPGARNIFYTDGESIDVLDSRSHQLIARINLENVPISSIENMAFSPEKGVLAISGTHNEKGSIVIGFWDLRSLRLIHVSERELGFVEHGIQFSKDETKFYLSYKNPNDQNNLIEVWEIREQADSNPVAFTVLEAALLE